MFQYQANNIRSRLRLTASVLVVAAAMAGGASAATYTLSAGNSPFNVADGTTDTVIVTSGTAAYFNQDTGGMPAGDLALVWGGNGNTSADSISFMGGTTGADIIVVNSGASLEAGPGWSWQAFQSMFQVSGNFKVDAGVPWGIHILGTNYFYGDVAVGDGSAINFGEDWSASSTSFGPNTNFILGGHDSGNNTDSNISFYGAGSSVNTVNTISSAAGDPNSAFNLYSGKLIFNGHNTVSSAFYGTFNVKAGATLMVGDATHSTAVLGDPTGSTATVNIAGGSSAIGVLAGYGTIDASVNNNNGIVKPGGTSGTLGTLTINGAYNQTSSGQLIVEVSPTGASSLRVNGAASLGGSLVVNLDSGTYGNAIYTVLSANSITGGLSVSTIGNVTGALIAKQITTTSYNIVTEKYSAAQTFGHVVGANRNALYQFSRSLYDVIAFGAPAGSTSVSGGKVDIWLAPIGEIENVGRDGAGYETKSYGLSVGAEHRFAWKNAVLGGAFSYRTGNMNTKDETSTTSSNGYDMAVYGGADVQDARLDGMVFYNINDASSKRLMTTYGTAAGDEKGWAWGASIQLSRNFFNDRVTPYLRGTFARVHQDGASESGTGTFDLAYNAIDENTFAADAGLRIHVLRPQEARKIKLDLDLAVRHDFSDPGEITTGGFATLDGSSFTYKWKGDSGNALLVGLNVSETVIDKLEIFGRLNGSFSLYRRAGEISFGAKYHL